MENENIQPATSAEFDSFEKQLLCTYPRMGREFWHLVRERAEKLGYSRKRLQHILHVCIDTDYISNDYRYLQITPGLVLSVKPVVEYLDYQDAVSPANFSRVVRIFDVPKYPQKYHLCLREDAEKTDFPFEGFV